jgi:hypothetical protein
MHRIGHFCPVDPECVEDDVMLRLFVSFGAWIGISAAHRKLPGRHKHHCHAVYFRDDRRTGSWRGGLAG